VARRRHREWSRFLRGHLSPQRQRDRRTHDSRPRSPCQDAAAPTIRPVRTPVTWSRTCLPPPATQQLPVTAPAPPAHAAPASPSPFPQSQPHAAPASRSLFPQSSPTPPQLSAHSTRIPAPNRPGHRSLTRATPPTCSQHLHSRASHQTAPATGHRSLNPYRLSCLLTAPALPPHAASATRSLTRTPQAVLGRHGSWLPLAPLVT
jgi:hypothetical protein